MVLTIKIEILIRDFLQLLVNYVTCELSNLSYFFVLEELNTQHRKTVQLHYIKSWGSFNHRRIRLALKGPAFGPVTRGVWGHAPPENFEILVL